MSVTTEDLRQEVGAHPDDSAAKLSRTLAEARTMVDAYVAEYGVLREGEEIPVPTMDAAVLACAVDLWTRKNASHGVMNEQYDADMGGVAAPVRISRDPLRAFDHLLSMYCVRVGFA